MATRTLTSAAAVDAVMMQLPPDAAAGATATALSDGSYAVSVDDAHAAALAAADPAATSYGLIAYANTRQWQIATGGVTVDLGGGQSMTIQTDTITQGLLAGKILRLSKPNPPATVTWQTSPTTFVALPAATVEAIGLAVDAHVQGTFDTLEAVLADIASGTITSEAQIEAAFAA